MERSTGRGMELCRHWLLARTASLRAVPKGSDLKRLGAGRPTGLRPAHLHPHRILAEARIDESTGAS